MDCPQGRRAPVTRVPLVRSPPSMFRARQTAASPYNLAGSFRTCEPAGRSGGTHRGREAGSSEELNNLIEKRSRVSRPRSMLHTILLSRYLIRDGAAPSQFE